MKVGIYNRWLSTMGGGEQHMGAIARSLARGHDVELISHEHVDLSELRAHLGMDLGHLPLRVVPYEPGYASVKQATADYDLFVNSSHLDIFAPASPLNAMLVFFPGPLPPATPRPPGDRPRLFLLSGFHALEDGHREPRRWTDGAGRLLLRGLRPGLTHRLRLVVSGHRPPGAPPARLQLYLNNEPLGSGVRLPPRGRVLLHQELPPSRILQEQMILRVESTTFTPMRHGQPDARTLGVMLMRAEVVADDLAGRVRRRVRRPTPISRLGEGWSTRANTEDELDRYQLLFANSRYTQRWIRERWKRPSRVLYPLVPVEQFAPREKRPQIISVGRFFRGSHNKKHIPMIRAFRELCDRGLTGWHYHLVGGTHDEPEHQAYLREVRAEAAGYPITIHADIPFSQLQVLYGESALYWNATGWGESERDQPEAFEHFGITTVEAMASGCVPISFARAGQPEIIQQGTSGLLWNDLRECQAFTEQLVRDEARRQRMAAATVERSRNFAEAAFEESLTRSIDRLVARHADPGRVPPERLASRAGAAFEQGLADAVDLGFSEIRARW